MLYRTAEITCMSTVLVWVSNPRPFIVSGGESGGVTGGTEMKLFG
jgi:hypothetical protein